jgi:ubiquinone/menaquinone biosynthesis C-methylase UbiE
MSVDSSHPEYVLGHSTSELDRLIRQAAFYGDLTAHTVKLAGLVPGMRVLDVGCGAGDVSLLAASIVGPTGHVTGVDQNADALALAGSRVAAAGISHLTFESGDIAALPYAGQFDAVIGRLVILYLGDPVAGIKAFASYLKPGGLLYFQEFCPAGTGAVPPVPLYDEVVRVINETFARAKIDLYIGMRLGSLYQAAGLPPPTMLGMARVETGPDSPIYTYLAETVRSLLPLAERVGVTTAEEIGIETLAERLRQQAVASHSVLHGPELVAAWTRVG